MMVRIQVRKLSLKYKNQTKTDKKQLFPKLEAVVFIVKYW